MSRKATTKIEDSSPRRKRVARAQRAQGIESPTESIKRFWLAALDDFRDWLVRAA
jgi:hypothetical protein